MINDHLLSRNSEINYVEIFLPYFKTGDDLSSCIHDSNNLVEAFKLHAAIMQESKEQLEVISSVLEKHKSLLKEISIDANNHSIVINGPDEILKDLIAAGVAEVPEWIEDCEDHEDLLDKDFDFDLGVDLSENE